MTIILFLCAVGFVLFLIFRKKKKTFIQGQMFDFSRIPNSGFNKKKISKDNTGK
jgi:hypothetical protein